MILQRSHLEIAFYAVVWRRGLDRPYGVLEEVEWGDWKAEMIHECCEMTCEGYCSHLHWRSLCPIPPLAG